MMHTKSGLPSPPPLNQRHHPLLEFYWNFNQLKNLFRQGWIRRGVSRDLCETVAEHSFGVAMLAWIIAKESFPELDLPKIIQMALIHDLGEVFAGDIIPSDRVDPLIKQSREREGVVKVLSSLEQANYYLDIWEEFERGESKEARLVREIDHLEMGLQAFCYGKQGFRGLEEFLKSAITGIQIPELKDILDSIRSSIEEQEG